MRLKTKILNAFIEGISRFRGAHVSRVNILHGKTVATGQTILRYGNGDLRVVGDSGNAANKRDRPAGLSVATAITTRVVSHAGGCIERIKIIRPQNDCSANARQVAGKQSSQSSRWTPNKETGARSVGRSIGSLDRNTLDQGFRLISRCRANSQFCRCPLEDSCRRFRIVAFQRECLRMTKQCHRWRK
jgi:hypothetical protein